MRPLGKHLLADFYDCDPERLDDVDLIATCMKEAAQAAGATVLHEHFHRFSPCGVTGVLSLRESHLAIHTWPERGFAAVDLFTCGEGLDPWRAHTVLKEGLNARRDETIEMPRGQP